MNNATNITQATTLLRRWRKLFTDIGCPDVEDGRLFSETGAFCSTIKCQFQELEEVDDGGQPLRKGLRMGSPSRDLPLSEYPRSVQPDLGQETSDGA